MLSRRAERAPWRIVGWDAATLRDWAREVDGADVVINLAGRNVNCRHTPANRRAIMDSQVDSTRAVGAAIGRAKNPPRVWLQASIATIYAHRFDAPNDEATGILVGSEPNVPETWRFSTGVAREGSLDEAVTPGTRKVALRDDDEPRCQRHLRCVARPGAARTRRDGRGRSAIRLLDPRPGFRPHDRLADRA